MSEQTAQATQASKEAQFGNWKDEYTKDKNNGGQKPKKEMLPFVAFDHEGKYIVRLVGKHVHFLKYFFPFKKLKKRVITHEDYADVDPAWKAGFPRQEMAAIHVIDRSDGKLKILEKNRWGIFKAFQSYMENNNINPSSLKEGPDFVIEVRWPNGNKNAADYTVTALARPSPLTKEEIEMCNAQGMDLRKFYKATPIEKIKEYWEQLSPEDRIPPVKEPKDGKGKASDKNAEKKPVDKSPTTNMAVEEELPGSPAEEKDLFADDNKEDVPF